MPQSLAAMARSDSPAGVGIFHAPPGTVQYPIRIQLFPMGPDNRPLDLEWLEDFQALAESGNFSRAAELRAIAQPAFSRHIRSLEEWVGVPLVDRGTHPASLTDAGKRFLPAIDSLLENLQMARRAARDADGLAAQRLRFAATHVLSLHYFPTWLAVIEAQLALGQIEVVSDSMAACEELMLQRKVQFVLCHSHTSVAGQLDEPQFISTRIGDDVLLPVARPDSGGTSRWWLAASIPHGLPVLGYSEASGLGRILRHHLAAAFLDHPIVFRAQHAELLRTMVLDGRGVAWLPRSLIQVDLQHARLVLAGDERWQVPLDIRLFRRRAPQATAAEAFWQQAVSPP
jgi:LysR family transcriptional regulator, hypochlorite-specific transcription factor HypT